MQKRLKSDEHYSNIHSRSLLTKKLIATMIINITVVLCYGYF